VWLLDVGRHEGDAHEGADASCCVDRSCLPSHRASLTRCARSSSRSCRRESTGIRWVVTAGASTTASCSTRSSRHWSSVVATNASAMRPAQRRRCAVGVMSGSLRGSSTPCAGTCSLDDPAFADLRRRPARAGRSAHPGWPAAAHGRGCWPGRALRRCTERRKPCVEAYLARGPRRPRMSTRAYRLLEWRSLHPRRIATP